jgi:3-hydroxybutyrate dehydrogenase
VRRSPSRGADAAGVTRVSAISGRQVVVTGAAGGLGGVIGYALRERGARLLLVDVDEPRLRHAAERLQADWLPADVADPDGRRAIAERCGAGGPDVLINNAGIEKASEYQRLEEAEIRHALEVNLLGAMLLTHALLPGMERRGRGHVITVASMAAVKPVPYNAVYNTAKAGLVAFSLSLSKDLAGSGVHATVICPSAVTQVGMWARASDRLSRNRLVESSVVGPGAVAAAVVRALERQPVRILVGSPLVRAGALLSSLSPTVDRATDRLSRIRTVYRERIGTDADRRL